MTRFEQMMRGESHAGKLIGMDELYAAQERVSGICLPTPVLLVLHPGGGDPFWVKVEALQRTGSFKLRGASNAVAALDPKQSTRGVVTYSAGNHGRALACAARVAGISATVVMPDTATAVKIRQTRAEGATVLLRPGDENSGAHPAPLHGTRPHDRASVRRRPGDRRPRHRRT